MNCIFEQNFTVPPFKSLKVIGSDMDRSGTYGFLSVIHSNRDLSRTVAEKNGDTGRKTKLMKKALR